MPTDKKFSELTPLVTFSADKILAVETDPPFTGGFKCHVSTDTTLSDAANNNLASALAIKTYVDDSISVENLWDRDTSGTPFLKPHNAGDDVDIGTGVMRAFDYETEFGYRIIDEVINPGFQTGRFSAGTINVTPGQESSAIAITGEYLNAGWVCFEWRGKDPGAPSSDSTMFLRANEYRFMHTSGGYSAGNDSMVIDFTNDLITIYHPLNFTDENIYNINSANTSGTKSFQLVPTLTGVVPASEHAKVEFKGLWQGNEKTFMDFQGSSDSFNVYCQDYVYDNNSTTVSQHIYKTELNNVGGTGIILQEFFGLNSTPSEYQYTQIGHIIDTNTAGVEDASMAFSVSESGAITEYIRLNGGNSRIDISKDINVKNNDIFSIDPSNTSGTKSYQIVETLTGVVPASEHAKVEFYGLSTGSEKVFMDYQGASDSFNFYCQDYVYDNNSTTISQHLYKTELNNIGGTGIILQEFFGLNSALSEYQYTQIGHVIETNTAGIEDGSIVFYVSEAGSMTQYLRLDGKNTIIKSYKPVDLANNSIAVTQPVGDNSAKVANTSFVQNELTNTIPIAVIDSSDVGSPNFYAGMQVDVPGKTAFTLSSTPVSNKAFQLTCNGVVAVEGVDYTLSGTSLIWTGPALVVPGGTGLQDILEAQYNVVSSSIESPTETNYTQAYDNTAQAIAIASTPQDVTFSTNVQLNGWTHTAGTANFTCNATGLYLVTYTLYFEKTSGAPSQMESWVNFNGSQVLDTHSSVSVITNNIIQEMSATSIISATTSQILKIQIQAPLTFFRLNQHILPEPTARITIVRIL